VDELITITTGLVRKHYYELTDDAIAALREFYQRIPKDDTFGNGRVARKLFESMVNTQASRLAVAPPAKDSELNRLTAEDLRGEIAALPAAGAAQASGTAGDDPVSAVRASIGGRQLDGMVGQGGVRAAVGAALVRAVGLARAGTPLGHQANVVIGGRRGSGRRELADRYAQTLIELDAVAGGRVLHASVGGSLHPRWPGQAAALVGTALRSAEGGILVVDLDGDWPMQPHTPGAEVLEALADGMRRSPADPVVVVIGERPRLNPVLSLVPAMNGLFAEGWELTEYTVDELAEAAVRLLVARGHDVPDEVREVIAERLGATTGPTVHTAHQLARQLSTVAASRTLAAADLLGTVPVQAGSPALSLS
jgi:hypothetical protein